MESREPSISEVRGELQSILNSRGFRQSQRLGELLRYVCTKAIFDGEEQISEYTIALDVLGKAEDFKESKDAIVRVELHRLRKKLAELLKYFDSLPIDDPRPHEEIIGYDEYGVPT